MYDEIEDKDLTGDPELLFIDRLLVDPTMSIHEVPDVATWQIDFTYQRYADSVMGDQANTDQSGNRSHGFGPEWQRFLVNSLAADCGNGPVRRIPRADITDMRQLAQQSLSNLIYSNREKKSQPSRTARWGGR